MKKPVSILLSLCLGLFLADAVVSLVDDSSILFLGLHLLEEIHARVPRSENIMVPWGMAHLPGIAEEIQKSGFRLVDSQEYKVFRFRSIWRPKQKGQQKRVL